ncbi:MAG: GDSL-type esterase/lipase family protein [Pseudomonadota bacterium]
MLAYEAQDQTNPPPTGAVVVTGSSTIQLWTTINADLSPLTIISRGLGGSTADDIDYYLERMVLVYRPRAVVLYEGDNDIGTGATPQYVANRIAGIMGRITARYPNVRVYVISIKPSVARWSLWPQMTQANQLLEAFCNTDARYTFIDISLALLGGNGQPKPEYYVTGGLHLNTAGYQAWTSVIRPVLISQQSIPLPSDFIAPAMPTNLHATAGAPNRVDLYWNASSDNSSGLGGYGIYRNGALIATSTTPNFSDYSAAPNNFYSYAVNAFDRATSGPNLSGYATAVGVSTPPDATPAPTIALTATPPSIVTGSTAQLSWSSTNATSCTASGGWSGNKSTSGSATTAALSSTTTFGLNCSGPGGSGSATTLVTVTAPVPTVSLSANPTSIVSGSTTQLSWSSSNATSCTASGDWSGTKGASGTATTAAISTNSTFVLTCSGSGGNASATTAVMVAVPPPTVSLSANPTSIVSGNTTQLSWSSSNATSCTASGGWSGTKGTSGTATTVALSATTSFGLNCSGAGGNATATTQVNVTAPPPPQAPPPPPTVTLTSSAATVIRGGTIQLSWTATNVQSCIATGSWSGTKDITGTETSSAIQGPATFTLVCQGPAGTSTGAVDVAVTQPPPTVTISASPTTLDAGGRAQLTWSTTDADSCVAIGDWSGTKTPSGVEQTAALSADAHLGLNCTGTGGSSSASVAVTVKVSAAVAPLPAVTVTAPPSGGGGAVGLRELCALVVFVAALRLRKRRFPVVSLA